MFKKSDNKEGCLWKALEAEQKLPAQEFKVKVAMEINPPSSTPPPTPPSPATPPTSPQKPSYTVTPMEDPPHQEKITLPAGLRNKINGFLINKVTSRNNYYDKIPLGQIFEHLKQNGITILDDDGGPLEGVFLTGRTGEARFHLAMQGKLIANSKLFLSWHKFDETGRYEVIVNLT